MKLEELRLNSTATTETDTKPNLITAIATSVLVGIDLIVLLLNEFSVFRIDKPIMRICMITGAIIASLPIILGFMKKTSSKPWLKYLSISLISALVLFEFSILNIHAAFLTVLPLILTTQYKDLKVTYIAIGGSIAATLFAPLIGYGTGVWGQDG